MVSILNPEKYCSKCGEQDKYCKLVNGKWLCRKCRGIKIKEPESRLEKLKRIWRESI